GVDVSRCIVEPGRPTGVTVVLSRGDDRAIVTAPGTTADLRTERIPLDLLRECQHVHVSSFFLQTALHDGLAELLSAARATGTYTPRDPTWAASSAGNGELARALAAVDYFLPNREEARRIAGRMTGRTSEPNTSSGAALIAERAGAAVAVKRGAQGALLGV